MRGAARRRPRRRMQMAVPTAALAATLVVTLQLLAAGCFSDRTVVDPSAELVTCVVPLEAVARGDALVFIRNLAFVPQSVRISPGRSVTWINCEAEGADPHTSTADDGAWDSPLLPSGASFSRQFTDTGSFEYHCLPHPFMRGEVIVE
jgi:amicyanin